VRPELLLRLEQLLHSGVVFADFVEERGEFIAEAPIIGAGEFGKMILQAGAGVIEPTEAAVNMGGEPDGFDVERGERNGASSVILRCGEVVGAIVNFAEHGEQLGIIGSKFEGALEPGCGGVESRNPEKFLRS
jgi:hypothetical protein